MYAEHAGKSELDLDDLRLAIKSQLRHMFVQPPSREVLAALPANAGAYSPSTPFMSADAPFSVAVAAL